MNSRMTAKVGVRRRVRATMVCAVLALGLTACSAGDNPLAQAFNGATPDAGKQVIEFAPKDRGDAVVFSGQLDSGASFDSKAELGKVVVVNFWWAGCGPCRAEAKSLQSVWAKTQTEGVDFVGVNIRDERETAQSFTSDYGVTYPSILDAKTGDVRVAFANVTPISATPTTLVLDKQGRIAARIIGPIDGPSVLSILVSDAVKE